MLESTAYTGQLRKMQTQLVQSDVHYQLPVGDASIALNSLLGQRLQLRFLDQISCIHCQRKTNKSFNQGYCFPCFKKLAECDTCMVRPETCHYAAGTCREPSWAADNCLRQHVVYLANSSGVKVGITRSSQVPTRWMDQGAMQALPILLVENRLQSGLSEVIFAKHVSDKTAWQTMLKGEVDSIDLYAARDRLLQDCATELDALRERFGLQAVQELTHAEALAIHYPVLQYPTKVTSLSFDKQALIAGTLMGIKGQYLIFDIGVINIRKFAGYHIEFSLI